MALKLKEEHGFEPIYWNGYDDDDSKNIVPQYFPDAIYHSYYDAWKGVFPNAISNKFAESHIDIDFLRDYASYELQAIKMMDRMDPDRHSFSFSERQRHFRNMLKYWTACIDEIKPDLVISSIVPHRVYDYILYLLCKFRKIKYITFRETAFSGRIIAVESIANLGDILDEQYERILNSKVNSQIIKEEIGNDILDRFNKVQKDYDLAEPDYMKQHIIDHKFSSTIFGLTKKFFIDAVQQKDRYFGKKGFLIKGIPTYFKKRNKSIEKSYVNLLGYSIRKLKANSYKKKLKEYYRLNTSKPNLNVPYVIFTLHYQPEMTSNPSGGIFVDQMLCIDILSRYLPSNYLIYVKEHPAQFYSHQEGHTGRIQEFYDDLKRNPKVRLIPLEYDTFSLIKNSVGVATITGTSGWEAMVLGKPVICFGLSWYEKYNGVLKITDEKSGSQIQNFIENFKFNEKDLLAYLYAFSKISIKAYFYRGLKEKMNQPEEECIENLVNSIIRTAENE
ncbi:MAG: hypothetical protein PF638_11940 [Candidatus Delongbacteria bacterium]|nr:hypothetical protein [Candidatus Delongbacteria bacterium]